MEEEISREEFLESMIDLYGYIVSKQAELNRQLIDYLKHEKMPIKSSIDISLDTDAVRQSLIDCSSRPMLTPRI